MQTKLKIKIIKYNKNLFYVVVALNKKSIRACYLDKIGVCFLRKQKKIIMLSIKKLMFWLHKGVKLSKFVSYICSKNYIYNLKNFKNKSFSFINYDLNKKNLLIKKLNTDYYKSIKYLKLKKNKKN